MLALVKSNRHISKSWDPYLAAEFDKPYMQELYAFLKSQRGKTIYPTQSNWFAALKETNFEDVKVVILGQDPYHGANQAHGLSFSVPIGQKVPPSLRNIYKELERDPELDFKTPEHGCLKHWADQGVLLLNATLTVEAGKAGSHQKRGWEQFTDAIIQTLNEEREQTVFLLWGKYAQEKGAIINPERHSVLQSTHPSPFSAYRGFLGCGHFSQTNLWLKQHDLQTINWQLPAEQTELGFGVSKTI